LIKLRGDLAIHFALIACIQIELRFFFMFLDDLEVFFNRCLKTSECLIQIFKSWFQERFHDKSLFASMDYFNNEFSIKFPKAPVN